MEKVIIINTCVSMNCPFIFCCKEYNFFIDRGDKCNIQERIIKEAKDSIKELTNK